MTGGSATWGTQHENGRSPRIIQRPKRLLSFSLVQGTLTVAAALLLAFYLRTLLVILPHQSHELYNDPNIVSHGQILPPKFGAGKR
jgi:hypothetical protein